MPVRRAGFLPAAVRLHDIKTARKFHRSSWGQNLRGFGLLLACCFALVACSSGPVKTVTPIASQVVVERQLEPKEEKVFKPPTSLPETPQGFALPTPTSPPTATAAQARPSATPACSDDLRFLEDLTIPDGSAIAAGAPIEKRWLVENSGSCNWGPGYLLRLIEGPSLGAPIKQSLYPALSGTQATIRILFTAPGSPGAYRSAWQAYNPGGQAFGDIIYIDIRVR